MNTSYEVGHVLVQSLRFDLNEGGVAHCSLACARLSSSVIVFRLNLYGWTGLITLLLAILFQRCNSRGKLHLPIRSQAPKNHWVGTTTAFLHINS